MPIIGLTDRPGQYPRIGVLRKGAPKPEKGPGRDLGDHFRLDTTDPDVAEAFAAAYGEKPNNIRVMLMYATVEESLDCWKEHYSAGALKRRCDGQTCVQRLGKDGLYDFAPQSCECALLDLKKPQACGPVGRLKVIVPELARMGYILVATTSIHDIIELQSNLEAAAALRGDLRGIPFILRRTPRKVSVPGDEGKRRRMEKWLLSLEPAPDWVRLQIQAMQRAALPMSETLALPAPSVDEDTGEVFEDEHEEPGPTTLKRTGYLSDIDALYSEHGDFFFKAMFDYDNDSVMVIARDTLGEQLNDLPQGTEMILYGVMTRNTKKNIEYLEVQRFDVVSVPPPVQPTAMSNDEREALFNDVDAELDKAQVPA